MRGDHRPMMQSQDPSSLHPNGDSPLLPPQYSTETTQQTRTLPHNFRAIQSYEGKASNQELSFYAGEVLTATAFKGGWFWGYTAGWTGSQPKSGYFHPYHVKPIESPQHDGPPAMEARPDQVLSAAPRMSSLANEASHANDNQPFSDSSHVNKADEEKKESLTDSCEIRHPNRWGMSVSAPFDASFENDTTHLDGKHPKRPFHESSQQNGEDEKQLSESDASKKLHSRWEPPQSKRQKSDQSATARHVPFHILPPMLGHTLEGNRHVSLSPDQSACDKHPEQSMKNNVNISHLASFRQDGSNLSGASNNQFNETIAPPDLSPYEDTKGNYDKNNKTIEETTESSRTKPEIPAISSASKQQTTPVTVQIRIPDEQAMASRFPPGCPVLHEDTDIAGIVQSVHIQLRPPAFESGKHDILYTFKPEGKSTSVTSETNQSVSENELQFATRCPVLLSPSLFPKRSTGAANSSDDDDQWVSGIVVSSFKFTGDDEETYGVRLEGSPDGKPGGKIHGVARDQIRYRPPVEPAATSAAIEDTDGLKRSTTNLAPSETLRKNKPINADTGSTETKSLKDTRSNVTSFPSSANVNKDAQADNTITCSMTIPDTINFEKVREYLIGSDHSINERMRRSLRTDIFIIGNDLPPPKDPSIISDFRRLFPELPRNGYGQFQPCILMRGPMNRVKNTRKTITHLLVVKAYEGNDKENVRKQLNGSCKECDALADSTVECKHYDSSVRLNDPLGKRVETKTIPPAISSSQPAPIQNIPNTGGRDTKQNPPPTTCREVMRPLSNGRPSQSKLPIPSGVTGNEVSHTTTCRQFSFPGWIKYHEARACLEGQGRSNVETLYNCTVNVISKGYESPLKKEFIVISIEAIEKNLGLAWDYITDKVLGLINCEARGKFIYDMHLYNETSIKINKKESPVLYCRSLDAPSKKVYMYAKNYPRKGSFAKAVIGRGGANRTRALELGCDLSLHEGNISCGHYVLITGRTMESVEEAKSIVESSINGFAKQYHREEETYPDMEEICATIEQIVRENEPVDLNILKRLYLSKTGEVLKQADLGYSSMHSFIESISTVEMKSELSSSGGHTNYFLTIKRNSESKMIRNVLRLVRENGTVELRYLKNHYRSMFNTELDHKSLGHDYLYTFVASIRSITITKDPEDEGRHFLNIKERTKGNNRRDGSSANVVSGGYSFVVDPHSTSFQS